MARPNGSRAMGTDIWLYIIGMCILGILMSWRALR